MYSPFASALPLLEIYPTDIATLFWGASPHGLQDLISLIRDWIWAPAVKAKYLSLDCPGIPYILMKWHTYRIILCKNVSFSMTAVFHSFLQFYYFLYLWLCWVFVAVQAFSLVAANGAKLLSDCGAWAPHREGPSLRVVRASRREGSTPWGLLPLRASPHEGSAPWGLVTVRASPREGFSRCGAQALGWEAFISCGEWD